MGNLVNTITSPSFLTAVLAAISAAAVVFTFGASFFGGGSNVKQRIKRVALERERMRAEEMARLRGGGGDIGDGRQSMRRAGSKDYMRNIVERFSLQKLLADAKLV